MPTRCQGFDPRCWAAIQPARIKDTDDRNFGCEAQNARRVSNPPNLTKPLVLVDGRVQQGVDPSSGA